MAGDLLESCRVTALAVIRVVPRNDYFVPVSVYTDSRGFFILSACQHTVKKGSFSMKHIRIADTTLSLPGGNYTFKEKIEIARQMERLGVDVIELPAIQQVRSDTLLVCTIASFVKNATLSVAAGLTAESVEMAAAALEGAAHPCIRI